MPANLAKGSGLKAKVVFSVVVLIASGAPLAAKEQILSEDRVVLTKASPACAKREDFDTLIDLAQRRDAAGFADYMANHNCPVLQPGTAAVYEDLAFSGRAMCVRRPSDTNCLWIPSAAVQKPGRSVPSTVF